MTLEVSKDEKEQIYYSVVLRLGFIETGTSMRVQDAINCGKKNLVKPLSSEQIQLVLDLEKLLIKLLQ